MAEEYLAKARGIYDRIEAGEGPAISVTKHDAWEGDPRPPYYRDLLVQTERLAMDRGNYAEALGLCRETYAETEMVHGADNASSAYSLLDMGVCCSMLGEYQEAQEHLEHAMRINREKHGERSLQTMHTREAVADNEARRGNVKKAQEMYAALEMDIVRFFGEESGMVSGVREKREALERG